MKICYFGIYNPDYSRNRIILKALKDNGVEVIECRRNKGMLSKYFYLAKKLWSLRKEYDAIITGFPGNQSVIIAKLISNKPIIFDAFLSFYDSFVFDRQVIKQKSFAARYYWFLDWLPSKLADRILLDTQTHIDYFIETFGVRKDKFHRIFVGTDDEVFFPAKYKPENNEFVVHFHGYFLPLQGIKYIIEAAKILENENIKFNIIGSGKTYKKDRELADKLRVSNINFIKPVEYEVLADYIRKSDICLGIFGDTPKTGRVIPNKLYEGIACAKPVITADTPAIREIFEHSKHLFLCDKANSKSLADAILKLKNDYELRDKIAQGGYQIYKEKFSPKVIGQDLVKIIKEVVK